MKRAHPGARARPPPALTRPHAPQKYSPHKCEYEIQMDKNTQIVHCPNDEMENMKLQYHFRKLGQIGAAGTAPGASELIDVLGVVQSVTPAATIQRKDGSTFKVMKGAPQILLEMAENRAEISEAVDAKVMELAKRGIRSLAVSCTKDEHSGWIFMGIMTFLDPPRPDTKHTIDRAKEFGVAVKVRRSRARAPRHLR